MSERFSPRRITRQEPVVLNTGLQIRHPEVLGMPDLSVENITMRKLIIATLAAASLLTAVSAANAGYYVPTWNGWVYVPTCFYNVFGAYVCY
jgi:hypothetical protein